MTASEPSPAAVSLGRKPRDDEIDVFGLTHPGNVREDNQDHFLVCSLKKQINVHLTSLPHAQRLLDADERFAFMAMVADGVGGGADGGEASRLALGIISRYVAHSLHTYYTADATDDSAFTAALEDAALRCHADLVEHAAGESTRRGMATTLTLWLGVWPNAYLLQVGDSRYYALQDGRLTQISRDQTMAQELIDQGVLTRADAANTRWANVLSSSIGGLNSAPVVTRIRQGWDHVGLLCSDGLTKHVSDEQIRERMVNMTSAKQVCEDLVQDALDGGGTDNITVLVGRTVKKDEES